MRFLSEPWREKLDRKSGRRALLGFARRVQAVDRWKQKRLVAMDEPFSLRGRRRAIAAFHPCVELRLPYSGMAALVPSEMAPRPR